jgi:hypothetical protein
MIVKEQCSREITTKTKRDPHPYLRRYCHFLTVRIAGEPPAFRGKPRFCKKDTVKRRKDKERVLAMMRFANLRENRTMVIVWDQE